VLPTITAQATFQDFVVKDDIPAQLFLIPREYKVGNKPVDYFYQVL
jgi:hypothetical protein